MIELLQRIASAKATTDWGLESRLTAELWTARLREVENWVILCPFDFCFSSDEQVQKDAEFEHALQNAGLFYSRLLLRADIGCEVRTSLLFVIRTDDRKLIRKVSRKWGSGCPIIFGRKDSIELIDGLSFELHSTGRLSPRVLRRILCDELPEAHSACLGCLSEYLDPRWQDDNYPSQPDFEDLLQSGSSSSGFLSKTHIAIEN